MWSCLPRGSQISKSNGHRELPLSITEHSKRLLLICQLDVSARDVQDVCHSPCWLHDRTLHKQKTISKVLSRKGVNNKNFRLNFIVIFSRDIPVHCCGAQFSPQAGSVCDQQAARLQAQVIYFEIAFLSRLHYDAE